MSIPDCTSKPIDLGHASIADAEVRFVDGEITGLYYEHLCGGRPSPGYVPIAREPSPPHNEWRLEQLEPLTISPSLLCRSCGHHGFVRDGRWVPA